ncbi:MAG: 4-hydroxy-tetrahydrodipicolinate reductase [Alphaproteobacteria bacterium]|nr:4-hydroxy-tetrahydrodipicolinate reductase [Alphaproteobacteria bacterium]
MSLMRLVISGATGRMGNTLIRTIHRSPHAVITGAITGPQDPHLGQDAGICAGLSCIGVPLTDDPATALKHADGIIDFSTPEASRRLALDAAEAGIVSVIGVTGFSTGEEDDIQAAAERIPIIKSANMSLAVALLANLLFRAAEILDESFDIEILEMHHRNKVDAPSGTAWMLAQAAAQGRNVQLEDCAVKAHTSDTGARSAGQIGFAVLRGGSVVGDHHVILAGDDEQIELTHKAQNRNIFAHGALKAALWGLHQEPGLYSIADVIRSTDLKTKFDLKAKEE